MKCRDMKSTLIVFMSRHVALDGAALLSMTLGGASGHFADAMIKSGFALVSDTMRGVTNIAASSPVS